MMIVGRRPGARGAGPARPDAGIRRGAGHRPASRDPGPPGRRLATAHPDYRPAAVSLAAISAARDATADGRLVEVGDQRGGGPGQRLLAEEGGPDEAHPDPGDQAHQG